MAEGAEGVMITFGRTEGLQAFRLARRRLPKVLLRVGQRERGGGRGRRGRGRERGGPVGVRQWVRWRDGGGRETERDEE